MLSDGGQSASFIPYLQNALDAAGLSTGITCCDATGWDSQQTMTAALKADGSTGILSRITSHSYSSAPTSLMGTAVPVWMTEYADLSSSDPWTAAWYTDGGAGEGLTWAHNIYTAVTEGNVAAYLHWIGAQNWYDGNAPLVALNGTDLLVSARLWAFG
jgi:hypothetical protein